MVYTLLLLSLFSATNLIVILIFIELLSWLFLSVLRTYLLLKYLLVQGFFFGRALLLAITLPTCLPFFLAVKGGIPPFHIWFLPLLFVIEKWLFWFRITLHKLYPLVFIGEISPPVLKVVLGVIIVSVSTVLLYHSLLLYLILIFSSNIHRGWILVGLIVRKRFVGLYWIVYRSLLLSLVLSLPNLILLFSILIQGGRSLLTWLIFSGIPPFTFFWIKIAIFRKLLEDRVIISFIIIITAVFTLAIYYRVFHLSVSTSATETSRFYRAILFFSILFQ